MRVIGRYVIHQEIAKGGMAIVHMGRQQGDAGFTRTVAIKRLHDCFAGDPDFTAMFLDEARIAARIQHPNVVPILDVIALQGELFLIMEYVHGASLNKLIRRSQEEQQLLDPRVAVAIGVAMLSGLHAAHEARRENGEPLNIVHRDVNPQNVIVGADGIARMLDFGIAKAAFAYHNTDEGVVKGKLRYMAPEQVAAKQIDRRTDVFAASAVIWELLTGRQYIRADGPAAIVHQILHTQPSPPSSYAPGIPEALDRAVIRGLAPYPKQRYATAAEMAVDLEEALTPATARDVGTCVVELCADWLAKLERKRTLTESAISPLEKAPARQGSSADDSQNEGPSTNSAIRAVASSLESTGQSSVSTQTGAQSLGPARLFVLVASIAVVVVVTVLVTTLITRRSGTDTGTATQVAASSSSPPALEASVQETPTSSASAVASSGAPAQSASAAGVSSAAPESSGKRKVVSRPSGAKCKPPYVIGSDGVKRFKPECF